ncbi:PEP-CTERM sorting domain-containing protein [Cerasicoccus frondis]|uniref:PEP-CTERM sorting domain-containing protein n=1 Tax=Cerasicoccus frondis TaxID=490090 RepID=UPI002852815E|nr:PEP-CTERM sorting domain-containing protein [Cerasicoccus frondis]
MKHKFITAPLTLALCATSLTAQVLMFNFGSTAVPGGEAGDSPYHTENPTFSGTSWNELGNSDSSSLIYADGTSATGIALDLGRSNPLNSGSTVDFTTNPSSTNTLSDDGGVYSLTTMRSTIWTGNNNVDDNWVAGQITGLAAGQYEILIWGNNGNVNLGDTEMAVYVTSGSAASTFDFDGLGSSALSNSNNSSWTDGVSYSKATITIASGESIYFAVDGTKTPSFNRGFLSGVQVASIPEPGAYALILGACVLGLLALRRRGNK